MENSKTLHELFEMQARQRPQDIAVIFAEQAITYEQLNQKANQLAYYLQEIGIKPDTTVALCMERSIELLIAMLGVLKAGGAYVPLDSSHPEERLLLILHEGSTQFLITTNSLEKKFIRYQGKIVLNKEAKIKEQKTDNPASAVTSRHLAYVIYTSGSTGAPKGVLVEHRGVVDYSLWFAKYCDCQPQERIDFSSNHAFDFALTTSIIPLMLGLTVVICTDKNKKDPRQYLKYLVTHQVNFIKLTPSYFKVLLYEVKNKRVDLPDLEKIMLAGETLSTADCESWLTLYPQHVLFNEYGPTETSVAVCLYKINEKNIYNLGANVPIGEVAPHVKSYILDKHLRPVVEGDIGELYLGGSCLARGYLNNEKLTEQYFIKDPFDNDVAAKLYKTGDLCRRLQGEIECIGRIDHQIKIRGFRVEPAEVESCLLKHSALKAAAVLAFEGLQKNKKLVAYYVLKDLNNDVDGSDLRQYLQRHLPEYMIPVTFIKMDVFPLNANEKLDRSALPAPQFTVGQYYLEPKSTLEKMLAEIWSEELEIKPIGLKDNFFELGGHSLSAARVVSKINHQLGKEISLHDFYHAPTITNLAPLIKKAKTIRKRHRALSQAFKKEDALLPLSDFQLLLWLADTFEPKAKKLNIFTRKRFEGRLDGARLTTALESVCHKHEILCFQISKFYPAQRLQKNLAFKVMETNLESFSEEESELMLEKSSHQLITSYPWPKGSPQIILRLFHLKDDFTELQICFPHIIFDDVSPEILLSDLSEFYVSGKKIKKSKRDIAYRTYLFDEQSYIQKHLDRDMVFWDEYLKDTSLFVFPPEQVIKNMQAQQLTYSTYMQIPEDALSNFQLFCAHNHISILDGLCAVMVLALLNCCHDSQQISHSICVNRVKSTRNSQCYDNVVGCFLRIEPVKLILKQNSTLTSLAQEVHESVINTNPYQGCPNLVKLASIGTFQRMQSRVKGFLIKFFVWLYTKIFRSVKLNCRVFSLGGRLSSAKGNNFLINLNVQNSFLANFKKREKAGFFGLKTQDIRSSHDDLLKIDNLFDACFFRMIDSDAPFLVISANLQPAFRELIAKEVIKLINVNLPQH
ncbi:amino acid adenylation domain-containing protein [Legionella brunensis]|nr:amino acid adenylation domain-containing protein [Legionella brunensis]